MTKGKQGMKLGFRNMRCAKRTLGAFLVEILGHFHVIRFLLLLLLDLLRRRHDGALWRIPLRLPCSCLDVIVSIGSDV